MLSDKVTGLLGQIDTAIRHLREWNRDVADPDDYYCSPEGMKNLAASCMLIEAIGEGIKQVDKMTGGVLLATRPDIPWQDIVGMRNHIAHGYFDIDGEIVFDVVKNHLETLSSAISYFLEQG